MRTFDECRRHVLDRADAMTDRIKAKQLRADAFERVMVNHIHMANYPPEFKTELLDLALTRFTGRQ